MKLDFTCPDCGQHQLEEIASCEAVVSTIKELHVQDGVANPEYADLSCSGDMFVERYQCVHCGYVLIDEYGNAIDDLEKLAAWFSQRT